MNEPGKPHGLTAALAKLSTLVNSTILEEDEEGARKTLVGIAALALCSARPTARSTAEELWRMKVADAIEALALAYAVELPLGEGSIPLLRGRTQQLSEALFGGFALYARQRESSPRGTTLSDLGLD